MIHVKAELLDAVKALTGEHQDEAAVERALRAYVEWLPGDQPDGEEEYDLNEAGEPIVSYGADETPRTAEQFAEHLAKSRAQAERGEVISLEEFKNTPMPWAKSTE